MIEKITLPNGLRIVYEEMSGVRSAAVGIWIGVGSRLEKYGEAGAAHFIEHMLFKDTERRTAAELAALMDGVGGHCNAFTTRENTCFYTRVLDTHLTLAIDLLAEMFFEARFSESDITSESGVITEEIDMYDDTPEDLVMERLLLKAFPGSLGRPVLGRKGSVRALDGAALKGFMAREYRPDRVVVSLCGSFRPQHLEQLSALFSRLAAGKGSRAAKSAYAPAVVLKRKTTEQNHFCLAWSGLPLGDDERHAAQLMSTILGGGMSSRLFQTVREQHGLCYSIGSFSASFRETGLFGVSTATGRETEGKALALIAGEIVRIREEGVTPTELDRARELVKSSLVMSLESTSARMNRLGGSELQLGYCRETDDVLTRYDAVTREDVLAVTRRILEPGSLSLSAVGRLADAGVYWGLLA